MTGVQAQAAPARLLLVTSNGAGMGHLTRALAVALASEDRATSTILSMSVALPVVLEQGVAGEYCPSYDRGWMAPAEWQWYLRDRLVALAHETDATVVAFDGVAPYYGLLAARYELRDVRLAWIRRGMWRPGANVRQPSKAFAFDLIIEPGDLGAAGDRGATSTLDDAVRVPPISILEVSEPLARADAAAALGLDPSRKTVLVTLGSGRLGDIAEPGRAVVTALLQHGDWQIALVKAAIAQRDVPLVDRERVMQVAGVYPLARYLGAFDAVVSAAGYNAVHEFLPAQLPTLLIPNVATRTDDQVARANQLAADGLALTAHPDSLASLADGVHRLMNDDVRSALAARLATLGRSDCSGGAAATADLLVDLARQPARRLPVRARLSQRSREIVKRLLGPSGTDVIRRLRAWATGREVRGGDRRRVHLVADLDAAEAMDSDVTPLLMAADVPAAVIREGPPVEHLVAGSSSEYVDARRDIAAEYYDIVPSSDDDAYATP